MMLEDLGEGFAGKAIRTAVDKVVAEGFLTSDLNAANPRTTSEVGRRIAEMI
jgi:isocitrate/isopropylmalate dehydrogenase